MGPIPGRSSARGGPGWPGHGGRRAAGGGERGSGAAKLVGGPDLGEKEKGAPRALVPTSVRAVVEWEGELRGGRCSGRRRWWVVVLGGREGGRGAEGRCWGVFYRRARSVERRGVCRGRWGGWRAVRAE